MSESKINITIPDSIERNCPGCGKMMDTQVLVDTGKGNDTPVKILLSCPDTKCDTLSMTVRWPEPKTDE